MAIEVEPVGRKTGNAAGVSLPILNQGGATIATEYLERSQQVIPVNKTDLEDLVDFDSSAVSFGGFGMFLLSGAFWLLAENVLVTGEFVLNALSAFCGLSVVVGLFLMYQGWRMHSKKRDRLQRIFSETRVKNSGTAVTTNGSRNAAAASPKRK